MGVNIMHMSVVSGIWAIVGIVLPLLFFTLKGPNTRILQLCFVLTGFCCWLFWLVCYLAQMNPLIGPKLTNHTLFIMAREWDGIIYEDAIPTETPVY